MMCYNMCMDEIEQKLRADLAAATARIAELEGERDQFKAHITSWMQKWDEQGEAILLARIETLEAENAALAADTPTTATAEGSDIPEGHVQIAPHGHPEGWNCNCVGIYAPSVEPEPMTAEIGVRLVCRDGDHELCPTGCPCACACHAATAERGEG
jgi:hypothetical protein